MIKSIPLTAIDAFLNAETFNTYNHFFNISKEKFISENWKISYKKCSNFVKIYIKLDEIKELNLGVIRTTETKAGKLIKTLSFDDIKKITNKIENNEYYISFKPFEGLYKSCFHLVEK